MSINKLMLLIGLMGMTIACSQEQDKEEKKELVQHSVNDESVSMLGQPKEYPAPIESIMEQGVEIIDTFDAPEGMIGYAGMMRGQPMAIYVTQDKKHAVIGTLIDAKGNNLTVDVMDELVENPSMERIWKEIEQSSWVADGSEDAPVIIYTFTDANCPYCHKFREAAEPWIQSGKVQLRHVLVAILSQSSVTKAATILGSSDSEAKMAQHHENFDQGGVEIDNKAVEKGQVRVQLNTNMMQRFGYGATPTSVYKDENGEIQIVQGMPNQEILVKMMGSPKPK